MLPCVISFGILITAARPGVVAVFRNVVLASCGADLHSILCAIRLFCLIAVNSVGITSDAVSALRQDAKLLQNACKQCKCTRRQFKLHVRLGKALLDFLGAIWVRLVHSHLHDMPDTTLLSSATQSLTITDLLCWQLRGACSTACRSHTCVAFHSTWFSSKDDVQCYMCDTSERAHSEWWSHEARQQCANLLGKCWLLTRSFLVQLNVVGSCCSLLSEIFSPSNATAYAVTNTLWRLKQAGFLCIGLNVKITVQLQIAHVLR